MNCPVCLESKRRSDLESIHDDHYLCKMCVFKLYKNNDKKCPLCRTIINDSQYDLLDIVGIIPISDSILEYNSYNSKKYITEKTLEKHGIHKDYINTISSRLPIEYTGRFEEANYIKQIKLEFTQWLNKN